MTDLDSGITETRDNCILERLSVTELFEPIALSIAAILQ